MRTATLNQMLGLLGIDLGWRGLDWVEWVDEVSLA